MLIFAWLSSNAWFGGHKLPRWTIHANIRMIVVRRWDLKAHMRAAFWVQRQFHANIRMSGLESAFGGCIKGLLGGPCEYSHELPKTPEQTPIFGWSPCFMRIFAWTTNFLSLNPPYFRPPAIHRLTLPFCCLTGAPSLLEVPLLPGKVSIPTLWCARPAPWDLPK